MSTILILPGLGNSGPEHWQSHFESVLPNAVRVQQRDYDHPICGEWVSTIDAAVQQYGEDCILVSHSCGSVALVHWAARYNRRIRGALIVAPSDVERPDFPFDVPSFVPIPTQRFSFPATVVVSSADPYMSFERARYFAKCWGAKLVDIGPAGHINKASGYGPWPQGLALLKEML